MSREVRVGILMIAALAALGVGVFLLSERQNLFAMKNDYFVRFDSVGGLATGNPVELNGVRVGSVKRVVLPESVSDTMLTIWLTVDTRYSDRVREDSLARIKTVGLLGDKYIAIESGSTEAAVIPSLGEIPAAPATDVDKLIAAGGDAADNVVAISYSLRSILGRMERGEGILGELTTDTEAGRRTKEAWVDLIESVRDIAQNLRSGEGTLPRLINDDTLVREMESSLGRVSALLEQLETGDGALPTLLHDPETSQRIQSTISHLESSARDVSELAAAFRDGDGLLAKLLQDEQMSEEITRDLREMLHNLNLLSQKLQSGEGTLGKLIEDPEVYEALNDILVGVDNSKMLRWLVRNRQKSGIEERYEESQTGSPGTHGETGEQDGESP